MADAKSRKRAASRLAEVALRGGYVRLPSPSRRGEGYTEYKKGWELRLVCLNYRELREVQRCLKDAGIQPRRPFRKNNRWVQPVYGREAVGHLCDFVERQAHLVLAP